MTKKIRKTLILSYTRRSFVFFSWHCVFNVSGTRTTVSVTNLFEKTEYTQPIFQGSISQVLLIKKQEVKSLYGPWANGHLYTHQNNLITVSILLHRVKF